MTKLFKNGINLKWFLLLIGIVAVSGIALAATNPYITDSGASLLDALTVTHDLWAGYHHGDGTNLTGVAKTGSQNTFTASQIYYNSVQNQWKQADGSNYGNMRITGDSNNRLILTADNSSDNLRLYKDGSIDLVSIGIGTGYALCRESGTTKFVYNSGQTSCSPSSETVKHNIELITDINTPDNFMKIQPSKFIYNFDTQNRERVGIIAQHMALLYPEVVNTNYQGKGTFVRFVINSTDPNKASGALYSDGIVADIVGINYELYTAILTHEIQKQQNQLETQSSQIRNICTNQPTLCS